MRNCYFFILGLAFLVSCQKDEELVRQHSQMQESGSEVFSKISSSESKVRFINVLHEDLEYNFLNYPYLYAGAGVAIGDIDNDGLDDIYFTANIGANALYKNLGDFRFEEITIEAGVADQDGFSTGVMMFDVNADGWLDIYVSKAGSLLNDEGRRNKLFVNQKDGSFKEQAKVWGLDDPGYTTQAYLIDYDMDGDLDVYVLNYREDFKNNTRIDPALAYNYSETTSDHLYRNDGSIFTKVTKEAGLFSKAWGLSVSIGDFNLDNWPDIYVANDFLEPDKLYINQKNGTFKDEIGRRFNHISFNSMGSDFADLDNDLHLDLITVDMAAENYARSKENMASMSTENFMTMVEVGYHHAYMANTLHMSEGNGKYKEIAQMSGVVKTDWSWAPLLADFNNDGYKDIFISNGVCKDYTNQDFRVELKSRNEKGIAMELDSVLALMPSQKLDNYVYKNNGDLTFSKKIKEWGLEDPTFSNGAAYADLDNDGDLDLVVSNVNDEAGIYRNNSSSNFLQVDLTGPDSNPLAIGSEVFLFSGNETQVQEVYMIRGFQSSLPSYVHFGLSDLKNVDKLVVQWPDGRTTELQNPRINQRIRLDYSDAIPQRLSIDRIRRKRIKADPTAIGIDYSHRENEFNDFDLQLLIPQKQSTKGTGLAKGDVNGDELEDFFVGNAAGSAAALYIQQGSGGFIKTNEKLWAEESKYEDANAVLVDTDGDGDLDLYVVSAGYDLDNTSLLLQDRLYLNNGDGIFSRAIGRLPKMLTSGKAVIAGDFDADGDQDLFVGGNVIPGQYPLSPRSYVLRNDDGIFTDIAEGHADIAKLGMVSDATFTDYDGDKDLDLLVVGEWMQPTILKNANGVFSKATEISGLEKSEGWWFSIVGADFDGDGDQDYILGNVGKNNKFQPRDDKPLFIYANDFDENGTCDVALSKINEGKKVPVRGKECSSEQNPFLLDKIKTYKEFASLDMNDIYGEEELEEAHELVAYTFETVYLENRGSGNFGKIKLPNEIQVGPTLSLISGDFNQDGYLDVMGVGAIYDAEVETIRYDSNYGYVLLGDGKGGFEFSSEYEPFIDRDSKDLEKIMISGQEYYLVASNNAPLEVFTFRP